MTNRARTTIVAVWLIIPGVFFAESDLLAQEEPGIVHGDATGAGGRGPGGASVDVAANTGSATFSIPIVGAPGRNGRTPQLTLSYSSLSGSGIAGKGWNLPLSYLERVGPHGGVPTYGVADEWFLNLNGSVSRLVPVGGEYRTEQESFLRIRSFPNYWLVQDRAGTMYVFGFGPNSRCTDGSRVARYMMTRIADTNGNYIVYKYVDFEGLGPSLQLTEMLYNGWSGVSPSSLDSFINSLTDALDAPRRILFEYETRPDPTVSYRSGLRVRTGVRLSQIKATVGNVFVRKYKFRYDPAGGDAGASLLKEVQEYADDTEQQGLPPTTFDYSKNNTTSKWIPDSRAFAPEPDYHALFSISHGNPDSTSDAPRSYDLGFRFVDLNRDGCVDLMRGYRGVDFPWFGPHEHREAWLSDCRGGWIREPRYDPPLVFVEQYARTDRDPNFIRDDGVRMVELNGDAFTDLIQGHVDESGRSYYRAWLNLGNEPCDGQSCKWRMVADVPFPGLTPYAPPLYFTKFSTDPRRNDDRGAQFVDLNGDGITDIVYAWKDDRGTSESGAWFGTADGQWIPAPQYAADAFVFWINSGGYPRLDLGFRMMDVNGDGLPDLVQGLDCGDFVREDLSVNPCPNEGAIYLHTWLNTGNGWSVPGLYPGPPLPFTKLSRRPARNDEPGLLGSDINGDGLPDLIIGQAAFINTAGGWVRRAEYDIPFEPIEWIIRYYHVNKGFHLEADIDGDGLVDLMQNYQSFILGREQGPYQRAWRNNSGDITGATRRPDLLTQITHPLGGVTRLAYVPSTKLPNATCTPNSVDDPSIVSWNVENPNPSTAFALEIIGCVTTDPNPAGVTGLGDPLGTRYELSGGRFFSDARKQEFRGFQRVQATNVSTGDRSITFYLQEDCNKGAVQSQATIDIQNKLFAASSMRYQLPTSCASATVPYLNPVVEAVAFTCDGQAVYTGDLTGDTAACKRNVSQLGYDSHGNVNQQVLFGSEVPDDQRRIVTRQFSSNEDAWIVGLLIEESHYQGPDLSRATLLKQNRISYDLQDRDNLPADFSNPPTRGNPTGAHANCFDCRPTAYWQTLSNRHDQYGNVVFTRHPGGTVSENEYDSSGSFVVRSYKDVLTTQYSYDLRFGIAVTTVDANGCATQIGLDDFGRKTFEKNCADVDRPSSLFEYRLDSARRPGQSTLLAKNLVSYDDVNYRWSKQILDGFGRVVQHQQQSELGSIATSTEYNSRGLPARATIPYLTSATEADAYSTPPSVAQIQTQYDSLGRVLRVDNPDGTYSTTDYNLWVVTRTDENRKVRILSHDAFKQLSSVQERNQTDTYTTRYTYDGIGRRTRSLDQAGRETRFVYDALSNKIEMTDPDMGRWIYTYDLAGNLATQTNARGEAIAYQYDNLERLVRKIYPLNGPRDVVYVYDQGPYALGRLSFIKDSTGVRQFKYDCRGRAIENVKTNCECQYTFRQSYGPGDEVLERTLPKDDPNDEGGETIRYQYNIRGLVSSIDVRPPGTGAPAPIVREIRYNLVGKAEEVIYPNGTQTHYDFYPNTFRLRRIETRRGDTLLQQLSYAYDNVGNVQGLNGQLGGMGIDQQFDYDDLNRLKTARWSGGYGQLAFDYGPTGNMLRKDGRTYVYDDPAHAHAVTAVTGDGYSASYSYDSNGSLEVAIVNGQTRHFTWDPEDRLTDLEQNGQRISSYVYNDAGRRFKRITYQGPGAGVTLYLDSDYVIEPSGRIVKYIAGYARREKNPGQDPVQYFLHHDLLGSTSLITDRNGAIAEAAIYKPYGELYANTPNINERFKFTGKELDAESGLMYYGARYYDPVLGRFISADRVGIDEAHPQTLNRYTYALNNPMTLTDPDGQWAFLLLLLQAISGWALGTAVASGIVGATVSGSLAIAAGLAGVAVVSTINVLSAVGVIPGDIAFALNIGLAAVNGYYAGSWFGGAAGWEGAALETGTTVSERYLPKWANYGLTGARIALATAEIVNDRVSDHAAKEARLKDNKVYQTADAVANGHVSANGEFSHVMNPTRGRMDIKDLKPEDIKALKDQIEAWNKQYAGTALDRFMERINPFHGTGAMSARVPIGNDQWSGHFILHMKKGTAEFHVDHANKWKHFFFDMAHPLASEGHTLNFVRPPAPPTPPAPLSFVGQRCRGFVSTPASCN